MPDVRAAVARARVAVAALLDGPGVLGEADVLDVQPMSGVDTGLGRGVLDGGPKREQRSGPGATGGHHAVEGVHPPLHGREDTGDVPDAEQVARLALW